MKKIMIFFFILFIFSIKNVFAQDQYHLTFEKIEGVYSYRTGVNYDDDSHSYYIYKFNNMLVYCLQPGKSFKTYDYVNEDSFIKLNLPNDVQEKIELIGYYGRDYPGHNTTKYSMATQALIWELTGPDKVSYWTELNGKGKEIDISSERNEILRLVNNHLKFPNINNSIDVNLNKEIIINDTNNALDNYEIESSNGNEVIIENNTIRIIPRVIGESTIILKHKTYDNMNTIVFVSKDGSDSQILGRLRLTVTDKKLNIKLNTKGTKLKVNKIDDDGNSIKIEGIKFKIKNILTNEYLGEFSTNEEGYFITNYIDYGEYEIEEIEQNIPNYVWNSNKLKVIFNEETILKEENDYKYIETSFINERVKGNLEFTKEDLVTGEGIPNTIIELYDENDNLLLTKETDENGKITFNNLLVGKYYLVEKEANSNYILTNEKVFFEIKENGEIVKAKMTNEKKIIKVPKTNTSDIIINSLFGISFLIGGYYYRKETI